MQYGVYLPIFGPYSDVHTLVTLARDAEQAGWDGFFIWDHIAGRNGVDDAVDPWVAMAAIAVHTERIRIGALVTPMPRRRPWKLARETVSLDHLSGGRLIFSVGIGSGRANEWDNLGEETDPKTRGAMLDEGLDVLAGLWSGEPFNYSGDYYRVDDVRFLPKPVQQPRIPVWVGAYWPNKKPLRRAARWDGVFALSDAGGVVDLDAFKDTVAFVRAERARTGADGPFDIVYRDVRGDGESHAQWAARIAPFAEAGATWYLEHMVPHMFGGDWHTWPVDAMHARITGGPPR